MNVLPDGQCLKPGKIYFNDRRYECVGATGFLKSLEMLDVMLVLVPSLCHSQVSVRNVYIFPGIPSLLERAFNGLEHLFAGSGTTFHTREVR